MASNTSISLINYKLGRIGTSKTSVVVLVNFSFF